MGCLPLRLGPGVDLRKALDAYRFDDGSRSGFVIAGVGSLVDLRIRLAAARDATLVDGPVELVVISGSLSTGGCHVHVAIADAAGRVLGGHLGYGSKVRTTVELLLAPTEGFSLARTFDPSTGYDELAVERTRR